MLRVTSIGHIAHKTLKRRPPGLVTGISSQGIYLQLIGDLTLFLTRDSFRGPLTINIRGESGGLAAIHSEDSADFADNTITFAKSRQVIGFQNPLIWKPAPPPTFRKAVFISPINIFHQVQELVPQHPYLPLLESVTTGEPPLVREFPGIALRIMRLARSLEDDNPSTTTSAMKSILGAGPGLTPLGDDLLLGILLTGARALKQSKLSLDIIHWNRNLITAAKKKTTRVSLSLLSCAIQGSADERIIRVLDGLIAGRDIPDYDLESLLNWGSSSGMAVLAGIMMALSSLPIP